MPFLRTNCICEVLPTSFPPVHTAVLRRCVFSPVACRGTEAPLTPKKRVTELGGRQYRASYLVSYVCAWYFRLSGSRCDWVELTAVVECAVWRGEICRVTQRNVVVLCTCVQVNVDVHAHVYVCV